MIFRFIYFCWIIFLKFIQIVLNAFALTASFILASKVSVPDFTYITLKQNLIGGKKIAI